MNGPSNMSRHALMLICSASLALVGCPGVEEPPPDAGPPAAPCSVDPDCSDGERCDVNGQCAEIPPCTDDSGCRSFEYCSAHEGICRVRAGFGSDCQADADCGLGRFCALGTCVNAAEALPCARRADCPVGQMCDRVHFYCIPSVGCADADRFPETACEPSEVCNEVSGQCTRAGAPECTTETEETDCSAGEFCSPVGTCVQCTSDEQCGTGLVCNNQLGLCESENMCRTDDDCEDPVNQTCDPASRMCIPRPDPCTSDLHCGFAETCNVITGLCEAVGGPCRDDIYEQNDSFASATLIAMEGQEMTLDHLTLCPDDDDFYAIQLSRGERLEVQLGGIDEGAMIDLFLVGHDGVSTLRYAPGPPRGTAGFEFTAGVDAFYYVKVAHLAGNTPYTIDFRLSQGQACEDDSFEGEHGNNLPMSAAVMAPGVHTGLSLCLFDTDYYSVTLAPGHALSFTTTFDHTHGDIDLRLLASDGIQELDTSQGVRTDTEHIFYRSASGGDYLLEAQAIDRHSLNYSAELLVEGVFVCTSDLDEGEQGNNSLEQATPVTLPAEPHADLTLCAGDEDWYALTVGAGQRLYATVRYEQREMTAGIQFVDLEGDPIGRDWGNAGLHEAVIASTEAQQLYARVRSLDDGVSTYDLSFSTTPDHRCRPDAAEPNDTADNAADLANGAGTFEGTACDGDDDWYRIDAQAGQRLRFELDFHAVDGDLDLALFAPDRQTVLSTSEGVASHEEITQHFAASAGYYLRVYSIDTSPEAAYTLTVTPIE
jgi:hypothetical protein